MLLHDNKSIIAPKAPINFSDYVIKEKGNYYTYIIAI